MFKTRFLSGAVLVVLIAIVLYFGGYVTGAATLLLSLGGAFELLRIYKLHNTAMGVVCYITTVAYYALIALQKNEFIMPLIVGYVLICLAIYVIVYPKYRDSHASAAIMIFLYVVVMLSYMYQIRLLEHGGALVVLIFVCSWVNDTCAYLVGVKFGKHKMTPKLSPKKSIEGLIGGIAGAALVGMGYGIFM